VADRFVVAVRREARGTRGMMRAAVSSFLLVMAAITAPGPACAHGGKLQLARAPAGPYAVSAWTQPNPPRVGRLDVSVVVLRPDTGEPMAHVDARVTARHVPSSQFVSAAVGPDTSLFSFLSPALRHGTIELRAPGHWRVNISVAGPQGQGDVDFDLDAEPPWRIPSAGFWMGFVIIVVAAWIYHRARSTRSPGVHGEQAPRERPEHHKADP
jgi:hypothetical protein